MKTLVKCDKCGKNHFLNSGNYYKCHPEKRTTARSTDGTSLSAQSDFGITTTTKLSEENVDVLEDYNIYRLYTDTMHNSIEAFEGVELYYYSTDTGQRELERRALNGYSAITDDLRETIRSHRGKRFDISHDVRQWYEEQVLKGKEKVDNEEDIDSRDRDVRAYLTSISLEQISSLNPDEVEAISHYTSNGSFIARGDGEGIDPSIKERIIKNITSAFNKIEPRDDFPILYRGTSLNFINANIGDTTTLSQDNLPLCATTSEDIAGSFDKGVVLKMEIDEAKMIVPAAVSAWGAWEQEVLLDGNTEFEIVDIIRGVSYEENEEREEQGLERLPGYDTYVLRQT